MKRCHFSFCLFFIFYLCSGPGHSAEAPYKPQLNDFAYAINLETAGDKPIYHLTLPEQVYRGVYHSSLADVRVFNARGEMVPIVFRAPAPQQKMVQTRQAVAFFPLEGDSVEANGLLNIQIQTDGSLIALRSQQDKSATPIQSWLVDLSQIDGSIQSLVLEFDMHRNTRAELALSHSQDLHEWTPLLQTSLVDLEHGSHQLRQNSINLPNLQAGHYLKLDLLTPRSALQINEIHAIKHHVQAPGELLRGESQARLSDEQTLEFDLGGPFRVSQIRLRSESENTLLAATLFSRPTPSADWREHGFAAFYRLRVDDTLVEDEGLAVRLSADRYWQARLAADTTLPDRLPTVEFYWQADELFFLAQGEGPWRLAFGNRRVSSQRPHDRALAAQINHELPNATTRRAKVGRLETLRGADALTEEHRKPWLSWSLWALLIAGASLAGWMAWRLTRKMQIERL